MTRIDQCYRVCRTCTCDCTDCFRIPDCLRDLRIRSRLAVRDLTKLRPNPHLKNGRMKIEWQRQDRLLAVETFQYRVDRAPKIVGIGRNVGREKFFLEL